MAVVDPAATDRLLVDIGADGRVSVSTWLDGEFPSSQVGGPRVLAWPLDAILAKLVREPVHLVRERNQVHR